MEAEEEELRKLVDKYKRQILGEESAEAPKKAIRSREYNEFRREFMPPQLTFYEKLCNKSERILKLVPDKKKLAVLEESIRISHLNITPAGAYSLTILFGFITLFIGAVIGIVLLESFFIMFIFMVIAIMGFSLLDKLPVYVANNWRLDASNQMVICIFYIATYMRHTSNLENALEFASDHIMPPLSLDLRKVLWDVETEKYGSVKESLDIYLETWRKWNLEFIEAFHLIEASLYEPSEDRRLTFIDKALEVILQETYEKMLHYAHNLKNPITMLHMLGVILPILGLIILPLVVSFMDSVKWYHLAVLYNFILPVSVYFMGKNILSSRPTGYGDTDPSKNDPSLKKYKKVIINLGKKEILINPLFVTIGVGGLLLLIGFMPLILHAIAPDFDLEFVGFKLLGYKIGKTGDIIGPFGLGATVFSLFIPLGIGMAFATYFGLRSKKLIKKRDKAKALEKEFASGLFQLGNRIGDGLPVEIAFGKVAQVLHGTKTGDFFLIVSNNITKMGMSVNDAIFGKRNGALVYFPSNIIESSMKVMLQSAKKGPMICSQALINISQYIKEIHRVNERLRDLLADIISSMKSQISFLAPAIAGIVVGITSMISTIMGALSEEIATLGTDSGTGGIPDMFGDGIPTYFFQIVVGLYVIQIIYILTIMANGIENGADKVKEESMIANNMKKSTILYVAIAGIVSVLFNIVAIQILSTTGY